MRFLFLALFTTACNETKLNSLTNPGAGDGPEIEVDPNSLAFGVLREEDDPVLKTFEIKSIGYANLSVDQIEVVGDDALSFTILNDPSPFTLPPGASQTIDVLFAPMGADGLFAQAMVHSNDASHPQYPVDLSGEGALPELMISPDPLDFGLTYVGCVKENVVSLTNVGSDTLEIFSIDHLADDFTVTSSHTYPLVLQPAETELVQMSFAPSTDQMTSSSLTVLSNEPMGMRTGTQVGLGEYLPEHEQFWENPADPPSDIIFSVDLSCSMDEDAATLGANFSSFISQLSNYSTDWQIMVANDDNGCTNSGVLTPSTPGYASTFNSAVQGCSYCPWGEPSDTERLLTIASNAVENTDQGECNSGFMRSNALLHIVLVSDEPEQSYNTWDTYVDQMIAKKGNPANIRISAIAGDYPGGCSGNGAYADAGSGYWEAVNATGGIYMSFCSNWSSPQNLQLLAEASVIVNSYPLDYPAVESTIVVEINGLPVVGPWHYDASTNSVIFDTFPPEEGDFVRIAYNPLADCD